MCGFCNRNKTMLRDRVKTRVRIRLRDEVRVRNGVKRWFN